MSNLIIRPRLIQSILAKLHRAKKVVEWDISDSIPVCSELRFSSLFDNGDIPDTIHTLVLGHSFQQPLLHDVLPSQLVQLEFGYSYTHPLSPGLIPSTVKQLTLGYLYNHSIDLGVLPAGLTHLTLGHCFQSKLAKGILPSGLTHLTLGYSYNHFIDPGVLPEGLLYLAVGYRFSHCLALSLPKSLRFLKVGFHFVPVLKSGLPFVQNIHLVLPYKHIESWDDRLPSGITHLTFGRSFNAPIDPEYIPSVRYLVFGDEFDQCLDVGVIPDSIRYLCFGDSFAHPLPVFPHLSLILVSDQYPYLDSLKSLTHCMVFVKRGSMVYYVSMNVGGVDYEWFLQTVEELSLDNTLFPLNNILAI